MKNFNDLMIHGIKIYDEQKNTVKTHRTFLLGNIKVQGVFVYYRVSSFFS